MIGPSGLQRALLRLERLDHATAWLGAMELPLALTSNRLAPFAASPLDEGLLAAVLDRLSAGAAETLSPPAWSQRPQRGLMRPLVPAGAPTLPASVVAPRTRLRPVVRGTSRGGARTGGAPVLRPEHEGAETEAPPDALVSAAARVAGGAAAIATPVAADWVRGGAQTAEGEAAATSADEAAIARPAAAGRVQGDGRGRRGEAATSAGTAAAAEPIAAREVLRAVLARAVPAGEQPGPDAEPAPPLRSRQASAPGAPAPRIQAGTSEGGGPDALGRVVLPQRERPDPERHDLAGRPPTHDPQPSGAGGPGALQHAVLPEREREPQDPDRHDLDGWPPAHDPRLSGAGGPGALEHGVPPDPDRHDPEVRPPADDPRPPADDPRPLPSGAGGLAELVRRWERGDALPDGEPPGRRDPRGVRRGEPDRLGVRPASEPPAPHQSDDALASALERLLASELRRHGIDTEAG